MAEKLLAGLSKEETTDLLTLPTGSSKRASDLARDARDSEFAAFLERKREEAAR